MVGTHATISTVTTNIFILFRAAAAPTTIKRKCTVAFPWLPMVTPRSNVVPSCLSCSHAVLSTVDSSSYISLSFLCEPSQHLTVFIRIIIILSSLRVRDYRSIVKNCNCGNEGQPVAFRSLGDEN